MNHGFCNQGNVVLRPHDRHLRVKNCLLDDETTKRNKNA